MDEISLLSMCSLRKVFHLFLEFNTLILAALLLNAVNSDRFYDKGSQLNNLDWIHQIKRVLLMLEASQGLNTKYPPPTPA